MKLYLGAFALIGWSSALYLFLIPGCLVLRDVATTPATQAIPPAAWRLERTLTPLYKEWATARIASDRARRLSRADISGTEWPLFGSVFYLWGIEGLQQAWDADNALAPVSPKVAAKDAIEATVALMVDPGQAEWVSQHWGGQHLQRENVFYRMLLISALTSHARLTGVRDHLPLLKTQADSLADELSRSPTGLLDDYPGQCFPADVLSAIAAIHEADGVLGTDHSAFVAQSRRAYEGCQLDLLGLVPYMADSKNACRRDQSRGGGNSFVSLRAPLVWPDVAADWYGRYRSAFLQESWGAVGFREFPKAPHSENWHWDVDSGPVLAGHGIAASAFGVGAARMNGHFDDAYPLTLEMLATSWPLPTGRLAIPHLLSNAADAPYLGEAAILYNLTRSAVPGVTTHQGGRVPPFVIVLIALYFIGGVLWGWLVGAAVRQKLRAAT